MAIPFLSSIDLTQNQALRLVLHNATSDPSGVEGQIYYNTSTNIVKTYDGSNWSSIAGDITGLTGGDGISIPAQPTGPVPTIAVDLKSNGGLVIESAKLAVDLAASSITGSLPVGKISGILPVANGGTGANTLASNAILTGNGTSAVQAETTLTYDGTTLTQANAVPHFVMTDTTTNADVRLSSNSAAGSFSISADFNNEANTTKIHFSCDGDEVGHFRGNNAYVGSFRLFPEKNDDTSQGIFVGTDAAGVFDPDNDWNYKRIISYGATDTLHLYPGTSTTGVIQITSGGDIITKADTITFGSANATDPLVIIKNTTNDTNAARLHFVKDKGAAGADGDDIGIIEFIGDDAGQTQTSFAKIIAEVGEADNTDEAGKLTLQVASSNGTTTGLENGIVMTGHKTGDYVDITLGTGASSTVTIPGDLTIVGDTTTNNVTTVTTSNGVVFEGTTLDGHDATLKSIVAGADVTYTLPNLTGHVALFAVTPTATISATPAELNILDGVTGVTATELGYVGDVTSAIQAQLDGKQATITGGATTITSSNLTASRALVSNGSGKVAVSVVTATEVGYLDGVTSAIQTQLDTKRTAAQVTTAITAREFTVELDAAGQSAVTKSSNTYTVDHQLGSFNVLCQVIEDDSNSTDGSYQTVHVDVNRPTDDTVTVAFGASVTDGHYRILIQKIG